MTNELDRFMHAMAETVVKLEQENESLRNGAEEAMWKHHNAIAELMKENQSLREAIRHSLRHDTAKSPAIEMAKMQQIDMARQHEAQLRRLESQKNRIRECLQMYRCNCKTVCEERKQAIKTGETPKRTKCGWWAKKVLKDTSWYY